MTNKIVIVKKHYRAFGAPDQSELELAHYLYDHWNSLKFLKNFVAGTKSDDIVQTSEKGVFFFKKHITDRKYIFAAVHGDPCEAAVTVYIEKIYPNTIVVGDTGLGILEDLKKVLSNWTKHQVIIETKDYRFD